MTLSSRRHRERPAKRERGGRAGNRQDGKPGFRTGSASASKGSRAIREASGSTPGGRASSLGSARGTVWWRRFAGPGMSKPAVWRWWDRFLAEGVDGLPRDATRPPGKKPIEEDKVKARGRPCHVAAGDHREAHARHWTVSRRWPDKIGGMGVDNGSHGILKPPRPQAASGEDVQGVPGPEVRAQGPRRRGPVCQSARPRRSALGGREAANTGFGKHAEVSAHDVGS